MFYRLKVFCEGATNIYIHTGFTEQELVDYRNYR